MAMRELPFSHTMTNEGALTVEREGMSPALQAVIDEHPFVGDYLAQVPIDEIGMPDYYETVTRDLGKLPRHNLIYAARDGLFVHIYPNPLGGRDYLVAIEPDLMLDISDLAQELETRLVDYAEEIGAAEDDERKKELLLEAVDDVCTLDPLESEEYLLVTERELEGLRYHVVRDKMGLGTLQPLISDPYIEDISCSGVGPIFVEHKVFKSLESSIVFDTMDELDDFVVWLGECIKRPVTVRNPIVDAVLPDGSRINMVYGREIATRGSNFTIRKFSDTPISVLELIDFGTLNYEMAAYLSLILEEGLNMFVVGATASGKTTTLNALTTFILPDAKIVTIEDTPEVKIPHSNWCREVTRSAGSGENKAAGVDMFELLKAALRQRPDRIIVGEIRGAEGATAFQAMQTGHGVMSTFHASSVIKLIQRLTGSPINIPKTYLDNLNVALVQSAVRGPDGRMVRRVLSINEIVGYDPVAESFSFIEVFRWNSSNDTFEFPGDLNSFLLEDVIAMKHGLPPNRRKEIYGELRKRARIFRRLHEDRGVSAFDDFFRVLAEAHRQGLL